MKKLLVKLSAIVATLVAVFSLTACGGDENQSSIEKKIKDRFPDSKILKNQEEEAIKAGIKNPKECLKFTTDDKEFEYRYIFIETKAGEKVIINAVKTTTYKDNVWSVFTTTIDGIKNDYKLKGTLSSCKFE